MKKINILIAASTLLHSSLMTYGFSSSVQRRKVAENRSGGVSVAPSTQQQPHWIPMEIVELAAEDLDITPHEYVRRFSDAEALTSCDDDDDALHECDHFGQYLEPTKWLHLKSSARENPVNRLHFQIWKETWMHPHGSVEVADRVSKEALSYYKGLMESRLSSARKPSVRVKVVPASFGLETFEDVIWEALEDLMVEEEKNHSESGAATDEKECRAVTFVVAAADINDPILAEGGKKSPQAEFESDSFRAFSSTLREKLRAFSDIEDVPLIDEVELTSFHPLWKNSCAIDGSGVERKIESGDCHFPYPAVAVSVSARP